MRKRIELTGECEHGKSGTMALIQPVRAVVIGVEDIDDEYQTYVVWLRTKQSNGKDHMWTTVTMPEPCINRAKLIARIFNAYLKTEKGQAAAVQIIQHDLQLSRVR